MSKTQHVKVPRYIGTYEARDVLDELIAVEVDGEVLPPSQDDLDEDRQYERTYRNGYSK